jgi:aryl-alcohol dehydrogenase-like predicted oxidoreductase
MKYRLFGKTELRVSEIGFGAWAIGGDAMVGNTPIGWGPADDATSKLAIHQAMDQGINFFDTADFYGLGHSEKLLGETIGKNKEMIIATKVGHRAIGDKIVLDYSKGYIVNAVEESLRRLKRDYIDYYQLHSARLAHFETEACIEAMDQLKKEGKIRYWGLSLNTFEPEPEADYLMNLNKGEGFQLVFNLINQLALPLIKKAAANYGIIARMPLQFGLLTGKFNRNQEFAKNDHRSFRLKEELMQSSLQILEEKIWPLVQKYHITKTGLAMSFILSQPGISTVIPGIRTKEQAIENTSGIVQLEDSDRLFLENLFSTAWFPLVQEMKALG